MNIFSLRTVVDDIMLIVRNNNISESEDFSREQIRSWVLTYKAQLAKLQREKDRDSGEDVSNDDSLQQTKGPFELQSESIDENNCYCSKVTKDKIPALLGDSGDDVIAVTDAIGCPIQIMNPSRSHFRKFRRYTFGEPVCWYEDGYIHVEGAGIEPLKYIYVDGNFVDGDADDEDDVSIPGWMIPKIRESIMKNELSFMLNRPSDDDNNSTLSSVKPHGPQDKEK